MKIVYDKSASYIQLISAFSKIAYRTKMLSAYTNFFMILSYIAETTYK